VEKAPKKRLGVREEILQRSNRSIRRARQGDPC
jgi:hypothetical protein